MTFKSCIIDAGKGIPAVLSVKRRCYELQKFFLRLLIKAFTVSILKVARFSGKAFQSHVFFLSEGSICKEDLQPKEMISGM